MIIPEIHLIFDLIFDLILFNFRFNFHIGTTPGKAEKPDRGCTVEAERQGHGQWTSQGRTCAGQIVRGPEGSALQVYLQRNGGEGAYQS